MNVNLKATCIRHKTYKIVFTTNKVNCRGILQVVFCLCSFSDGETMVAA